ncbi:MAG: HAMP domain-containing histidine kinase [Planctomycetaceae bacterium]|nr:HAMP domain-containing histidine kinase [Planctomycetaceae bacterium]
MSELPRLHTASPMDETDSASQIVEAQLPTLLDRVLQARQLDDAVVVAAEWWRDQLNTGTVAISVSDDRRHRTLIAVAESGQHVCRLDFVDHCLADPDAAPRSIVQQRLGDDPSIDWRPFVDEGRVFGGMGFTSASTRALATHTGCVDATARLLAHARTREATLLVEKLASLAEFAAGAGHEINNPLGSILGRVQILSRSEQQPERLRMLATIGAQALRVRDMIGDAMLFARPPEPQLESLAAASAIDEVLQRFAVDFRQRAIEVDRRCDPDVRLSADAVQFRVVVSELLRNSLQAAPDQSRILVSLSRESCRDTGFAMLRIADQGPGLTDTDRRHLFDPFYSGRQSGRGLGFGLSKCWRIVTGHGGCLHPENTSPGFQMTVHWPLG